MKAKDLIIALQQYDPEATVELDVDIFSSVQPVTPRSRQTRRVVEVRSYKGQTVTVVGDGSLRPDEEKRLDFGLYKSKYHDYQRFWNTADTRLRFNVLGKSTEEGYMATAFVHYEWEELARRVQEHIMLRYALPAAKEAVTS